MPDEDGIRPLFPRDVIEIAFIQGLAGIDADHGGAKLQKFAAAVRDARLELFAWTVDDAAEARLRDLGIDAMTTDRPEEIHQALGDERSIF